MPTDDLPHAAIIIARVDEREGQEQEGMMEWVDNFTMRAFAHRRNDNLSSDESGSERVD